MTRVTRGYVARRRRKKNRFLVSGFRGAHSRHTRMIIQQKMRGLFYSHRDRGNKKRYFRRLWITRINAVTRENQTFYSYCKFIHNLYKKQSFLNRKILSQISISNKIGFCKISNKIFKSNKVYEEILK